MKTLRSYQRKGVAAISTAIKSGEMLHPVCEVPTGGGKALMIADMCKRILKAGKRVLVVTHTKELVQQNFEEFAGYWESALCPAGRYSAGLDRRDTQDRVVFCGIQSIYSRAEEFGAIDYVIVDEAHMIPKEGEGRYRTLFKRLDETSPGYHRVAFTATPYRMKGGFLHKGAGAMFDGVAYRVSVTELIDDGYLAPLTTKAPGNTIDTSGLRMSGADYHRGELEEAAIEITEAAVAEVLAKATADSRRFMKFFASGVKHAELIRDLVAEAGFKVGLVTGATPDAERDGIIAGARDGQYQALVSMGTLTTGFNWPQIDLLAVLRATKSAGLYVQIMGRGMRTAPGKRDCLVLDFGGNIERHGPINDVRVKAGKATGKKVEPIMKICPVCSAYVMMGERVCHDCGHEWVYAKREVTHGTEASEADIIDRDPLGIFYDIDLVSCERYTSKSSGKPMLRVMYDSGQTTIVEYWNFEGKQWVQRKAWDRWVQSGGKTPFPQTAEEAYWRFDKEIKKPRRLRAKTTDGKLWSVNSAEYD